MFVNSKGGSKLHPVLHFYVKFYMKCHNKAQILEQFGNFVTIQVP